MIASKRFQLVKLETFRRNHSYKPFLPHTTRDKEKLKVTIKKAQPKSRISIKMFPTNFFTILTIIIRIVDRTVKE